MKLPFPLAGMLLPPVCMVCGQAARPGLDCCLGCETDLARIDGSCGCCGLELPRDVVVCGRCARRRPAFERTWAGFAYRGAVEWLVHRFKFHHDLAAGRVLGGLLARRLAALAAPRPDLMVPVPLHWRRRVMRGFNQSELLCKDLSAWLGGLAWYPLLERTRATPAQSALPAGRRGANVRRAFRLRRRLPGVRHVALVDDVMTTGSTLDECARVLKRNGVQRVDVWVAARA